MDQSTEAEQQSPKSAADTTSEGDQLEVPSSPACNPVFVITSSNTHDCVQSSSNTEEFDCSTKPSSSNRNARQSTLTRSHAITLDEDSDGGTTNAPVVPPPPDDPGFINQDHLIQFLIDTCNKSAKDKNFVLRIEADLTQFVKDETRTTLPFPQMSSYQRMLVHRMASLFELQHNVDNSTERNFVVVSKETESRKGTIPNIRFKELVLSCSSTHSSFDNDQQQAIDNNAPGGTSCSKKILKRDKPQDHKPQRLQNNKPKSLEERTTEYVKARRRIFEDSNNHSSVDLPGSSKRLNWSSTDSSEDRMYLKPPFPSCSGGKLIKVESFESANTRKTNNSVKLASKSHSFGGYEESGNTTGNVYVLRGGKHAQTNSFNSISCSSSSSIRSSSFSKQDSSSSTTSGSNQSPSGTVSSGYKSAGSSEFQQKPQVYNTTTRFISEDIIPQTTPGTPQPPQQVMFCCWAVADIQNVPAGAIIIDPNTGQAVKNTDGSQYYYDPRNPPKFTSEQTIPAANPHLQMQPPPHTPVYSSVPYYNVTPEPPQPQTQELCNYFSNMSVNPNTRVPPVNPPPPPPPQQQHQHQHHHQQAAAAPQVIYVPVEPQETHTLASTGAPGTSVAPPPPQILYYEIDPVGLSNTQIQQTQQSSYPDPPVIQPSSSTNMYYFTNNQNTSGTPVAITGPPPPPVFQQQQPPPPPPQTAARVKNWVQHTPVFMAPNANVCYPAHNNGSVVQTCVLPNSQMSSNLVPIPWVPSQGTSQQQANVLQVQVNSSCQYPCGPPAHIQASSTPFNVPHHAYLSTSSSSSSSTSTTQQACFLPASATTTPSSSGPPPPIPQGPQVTSQTQPYNNGCVYNIPPRCSSSSSSSSPPRYLVSTHLNTAAAAVAHQQQQLLFAAAAAAMAMNNYTYNPGHPRPRGITHGSVTGAHVIRRPSTAAAGSNNKIYSKHHNNAK